MKMVNADDLKREISKAPVWTALAVKEMIDEMTKTLVRCKECIWRDRDNQGEDYCTYAKGLADINESSFCSWGEREGE